MDDDEDEDASLVEVWFDLICVFPSGFKQCWTLETLLKYEGPMGDIMWFIIAQGPI